MRSVPMLLRRDGAAARLVASDGMKRNSVTDAARGFTLAA